MFKITLSFQQISKTAEDNKFDFEAVFNEIILDGNYNKIRRI